MKKLLLSILLLFLMMASLMATGRYAVFKVSGDVKLKQAEVWAVPVLRMEVTFRDQFLLGEQSRLGIVDKETHRIYYTEKKGKRNVAQIITEARKQAEEVTGLVNKQIRSSFKRDNNRMQVAGASYRGMTDDAKTQAVYVAIRKILTKNINVIANDRLRLEKINAGEESVSFFRITNSMDFPVYVNVLDCSKKHPSLCFNLGYTYDEPFLLIAPGKSVDIRQFLFADIENKNDYLLFASDFAFDTQALQLLLDKNAIPAEGSHKPVELYFSTLQ